MPGEPEIYKQAVDAFGASAQLMMIIEECSELIQAISKWIRAIKNPIKNPGYLHKVATNMAEEIADVEIMCQQIRFINEINEVLHGDSLSDHIESHKNIKLDRLEARILRHS